MSLKLRRKPRWCWTCGRRYRGIGLVCDRCPPLSRPYPPRAALQRAVGNARPHGPDGRFVALGRPLRTVDDSGRAA